MRLVIYPPTDEEWLSAIEAVSGELKVVNAEDLEAAKKAIAGADCFFGVIDKELLCCSQSLRWVQAPGIGLEHYVFPQLVDHPAVLTNMRGTYSDIIADHVLGFILCFARGFHRFRDAQQVRDWSRAYDFMYLPDCTLGIVGLGGIGREVARRGHLLGMRVIAVDPREQMTPDYVHALRGTTDLEWMLGESDFVVICAPHTPQTEGLIGGQQLRQMRPTAFLVNVGRGIIVDLEALVQALKDGDVAGAGLDVFAVEPLPPSHPLWSMPNVIITPHVAGRAPHVVRRRQLALLLDNLERFLQGRPLRNVVDKEGWY